jgi:hypothetical protein
LRILLLSALLPACLCAATTAQLQIVSPALSETEGGVPEAPAYEFTPGETIFLTCRIANYTKSPDEKIHLSYTVQAFDSKGVPLTEPEQHEIAEEIGQQNKNWMPKIEIAVVIPPLVATGKYHILVKVQDLVAKTSAELEVPFQVRGHDLQSSDTLVVENFGFFRHQDDSKPVEKAVYKPGDRVWARFDITGFRYGPRNQIDVSYVTSVISPAGKVIWTQPEPAAEQSESFYPKRYISGIFGIDLQASIHPGVYTIAVAVKDAVGNQNYESKATFTVE